MNNSYIFEGSTVRVIDNKGREALIDLEDYPRVKQRYWLQDSCSKYFVSSKNGIRVYLHCFILGEAPEGCEIDHEDRNRSNCKRNNLRFVTREQNLMNRGCRKDNVSGYRGVRLSGKRYEARISVKGKRITLGHFDSPEQAYFARLQAEEKYYGVYAPKSRH